MRKIKNAIIASVVALSLVFGCIPVTQVKALNAKFTLKYLKDAPTTDWITSYTKSGFTTGTYVYANISSITKGTEVELSCTGILEGSLSLAGSIKSKKTIAKKKITMKAKLRQWGDRARVDGSFDY